MDKAIVYVESLITNAMLSSGLQGNLVGFTYLRESIYACIVQPSLLHRLTKELYPMIGRKHTQTGAVVERSMRHVIEAAYRAETIFGIYELLEVSMYPTEKPCNGCYIALVAELVKKDLYHTVATTNENSSPEKVELAKQIQKFLDSIEKGKI